MYHRLAWAAITLILILWLALATATVIRAEENAVDAFRNVEANRYVAFGIRPGIKYRAPYLAINLRGALLNKKAPPIVWGFLIFLIFAKNIREL